MTDPAKATPVTVTAGGRTTGLAVRMLGRPPRDGEDHVRQACRGADLLFTNSVTGQLIGTNLDATGSFVPGIGLTGAGTNVISVNGGYDAATKTIRGSAATTAYLAPATASTLAMTIADSVSVQKSAPAVTGTGTVGQPLTATTGSWTVAPVKASYQWWADEPSGALSASRNWPVSSSRPPRRRRLDRRSTPPPSGPGAAGRMSR